MSGPRVVVVGAGLGGLGTARELRRQGVTDVRILERADDLGGVWRDNTYPGAACDVPSPLYSWSWAQNDAWGRRYASQPEILDYIRRVARDEGLLDLVTYGQEVRSLSYDDDAAMWHVATSRGATYEADVVVSAVGQLSAPLVPDLPGAGTFRGAAFHSAQWRHDVSLDGRRVAVVGTGASAIQFVPNIVDRVAAVTVFQRSAPYVMPKPDKAYRPFHHRAFRRFPALLRAERRWTFRLTELYNRALTGRSHMSRPFLGLLRLAWRAHLRRQVPDPALRRALSPDSPVGCKRLLFSNDWYPALARDHVDVITEKVVGVEPDGVRTADGRRHGADVLIWGTGFTATEFLAGIRVTGRGGADLREMWREGARAYLGLAMPGFPNLFCVYGPNTNLGGSSIIAMMEAQATWIATVARRLAEDGTRAVEVRADVAERYDREMQDRLGYTPWVACDNWYRDGMRITTNWPGLVAEYEARLAKPDWHALQQTPG